MVRTDGRPTQGQHILHKLRRRQWVPIEQLCALPGGGLIMEPHARFTELRRRGFAITTRPRIRRWPNGHSYRASDVCWDDQGPLVAGGAVEQLAEAVRNMRSWGSMPSQHTYTVNVLDELEFPMQLRVPIEPAVVMGDKGIADTAAELWELYRLQGTSAQRALLGGADNGR